MSNPRTTQFLSASVTPEHARDIRARVWALVFDSYLKKEAATLPVSGPDTIVRSTVEVSHVDHQPN
jgi:hypothetical protein